MLWRRALCPRSSIPIFLDIGSCVTTGKVYFEGKCGSCHSTPGDLKRDAGALRTRILRPKFLDAPASWQIERLRDTKTAAARQRHLALLENYSADDVANLVAYLSTEIVR